jgi:hypothetical protein
LGQLIANYQLQITHKKALGITLGAFCFGVRSGAANLPLIPEIFAEMEVPAWATWYPAGAIL